MKLPLLSFSPPISKQKPEARKLLTAHLVVLIRVVKEVVGRKLLVSVARNKCLNNKVAVEAHLAQLHEPLARIYP